MCLQIKADHHRPHNREQEKFCVEQSDSTVGRSSFNLWHYVWPLEHHQKWFVNFTSYGPPKTFQKRKFVWLIFCQTVSNKLTILQLGERLGISVEYPCRLVYSQKQTKNSLWNWPQFSSPELRKVAKVL